MARRSQRKDYLKPKEVATLLRVEPGTIRRWTQDGKLRATTTPGGHRRFSYRDVEMFARKHGIALPSQSGGALRLLVVDDDEIVASTIKKMLLAADPEMQVDIAHDGFSAGQIVEKFKPHIIILDLIMPGVDGYQLCATLKHEPATKDIRIIAVTGDANPDASAKILELGAEACLPKPLRKEQLLEAIGI